MNKVLQNFWLRNLSLLICLQIIIHFADPFSYLLHDRLVLVLLIVSMYVLGTLHNWMFYYFIFQKKQILYYLILFLPLFGLIVMTDFVSCNLAPHKASLPEWTIFASFFNSLLFLLVAFGLNAAYRDLMQRQDALENELIGKRSELRFLQNQVNPHFLFNSLNNLYASSIAEPETVSERILQMAELLRYQLSCSKYEFVPLQEEVDFLRNYMDVEKRRLGRQLDLKVSASDSFRGQKIAPLIFFPFLENAFKYSTGGVNTIHIQVEMKMHGDEVQFSVKNTLPQSTISLPASTGIGIENVKKRLNLLYPDRYTLLILPENEQFTVDLRIQV
jgi:sensor histidine kinase YesM